jgi:hypothetical protein
MVKLGPQRWSAGRPLFDTMGGPSIGKMHKIFFVQNAELKLNFQSRSIIPFSLIPCTS